MGSISGGLNSLALTEARNVAEDEDILKPEDVQNNSAFVFDTKK